MREGNGPRAGGRGPRGKSKPPPLPRGFFACDAAALARKLIGCRIVRVLDDGAVLIGRIVETEAYLGVRDRASHAYAGRRTPRNESMYARPGTAYVYFTYGMHFCLNAVGGSTGEPAAVLIRAIQPLAGLEAMHRHRAAASKTPPPDHALGAGPARLCRALRIDRMLDGVDLTARGPLYLAPAGLSTPLGPIARCARIGIGSKGGVWIHKPLRWVVRGHPSISVPPPARGKGE